MKNKIVLIAIAIIIAIILIIFALNYEKQDNALKDTWKGFYYPRGCVSCEEEWIYSPYLNSYDDCVDWALSIQYSRVQSDGKDPLDKWECGSNCIYDIDINMWMCEETKGTPGTSLFN
ncbi:hypothetical protein KKC65_02890 [Patescibacteria group bacterium]|nr:hypothetical protein [Patescibacteria group bacterium]